MRDGEGDQAAPGLEEQEPNVVEHMKQNEVEGREMTILGLVGVKDPQKYMSLKWYRDIDSAREAVEDEEAENSEGGEGGGGQVKIKNKYRRRKEKCERVVEELKQKDEELEKLKRENEGLKQRVRELEGGGVG